MEKIFNFEDRLVRFARECIFFTRQLERLFENEYYKNQLIRSSGSASLNLEKHKEQLLIKILFSKFH